jgi:hypothetical protein
MNLFNGRFLAKGPAGNGRAQLMDRRRPNRAASGSGGYGSAQRSQNHETFSMAALLPSASVRSAMSEWRHAVRLSSARRQRAACRRRPPRAYDLPRRTMVSLRRLPRLAAFVPEGTRLPQGRDPLPDDRHHLLFRKTSFRIAPSESGASLSTYRWPENSGAGQVRR